MKFRLTGTGNSAQVPCFGCRCPACERARSRPEHRRAPCGAEIHVAGQRYLIDAGRQDLVETCEFQRPAAFLMTHYHADHAQALMRLRWGKGPAIPVHGPRTSKGFDDLFAKPGLLEFQAGLEPFQLLQFDDGLAVVPVPLNHSLPTIGYCMEGDSRRLAYLTDTQELPVETNRFLLSWQPDVVILDATLPPGAAPGNHNTVPQALAIIERLDPAEAWLTHLSHEVDELAMQGNLPLPSTTRLAYDGLWLEI
ncbi:phosphonate metabolism protein PhnP [Modicisalibacter xianhensis]|uniref:Phosphoribosyl 1,2-cyclic phosphate phosphodiesterase n=1 Tax=Modicisalibacter xianhensis TaxID=442341 RepID=A0A1I2YZW9_9GAMM|nr:phosphonate metabolism protein PhnP [Halomonas xianhensis]SFH30935.1 phosphoribosyl 1,2-cyclic phosphate phosphodiesterase [Halomonas xianhensis]